MILTEFLLARIAEDEAVACSANGEHGHYPETWWGQSCNIWSAKAGGRLPEKMSREDADHIARHDPARVLAECEAKRRVVAEARALLDRVGPWQDTRAAASLAHSLRSMADVSLSNLAAVYSDHPDYRQEWKP